jgi:hypothetical protein
MGWKRWSESTGGAAPRAAGGNELPDGSHDALQMRMDINLDVHCPAEGTPTGGTPATGVATFAGYYPPPVPAAN